MGVLAVIETDLVEKGPIKHTTYLRASFGDGEKYLFAFCRRKES
jgi:hypothetical protein